MAADGVRSPESNELPLTHEFLALMLGTQRPGVTIALHCWSAGLITTRRSAITILDRKALEEAPTAPTSCPPTEGNLASMCTAQVRPQLVVGCDKRSTSVLDAVNELKRRDLNASGRPTGACRMGSITTRSTRSSALSTSSPW
jgi:hypothetical protein